MITYTGRKETIAKNKLYKEFCPTLNNTADTQLCFADTEEHVCADNSVLKHKEKSCSLSCGEVGLTQSSMLFDNGRYVDTLQHSRLEM